ncbi:MAG: ABC transporter substrate-binding protein [Deltaproteobacteria bacterium]|nr:ABC transporter substrate-binding protein [Deltaproteobacteria bacterium]
MKEYKRFMRRNWRLRYCFLMALFCLTFLGSALGSAASLFAYPVSLTDSGGNTIILERKPQNVISLVPAITEIIFALGEGESIKGITYHDTCPPGENQKSIVGGFFAPSPDRMEALGPDLIFVSSLHREIQNRFSHENCRMIQLESHSIDQLYENIRSLGLIFEKTREAEAIVEGIQNQLRLVAQKIDKIPGSQRKRVIRLMGRDRVMTPGDDSFQNAFIRAAGGIPPELGKKGNVVDVSLEEWTRFNPQVIYGCNGDREVAGKFFSQPGWKDVEAVRTGRIFYLPCELTCRASVRSGDFVQGLASLVYEEEFSSVRNRVLEEKRVQSKPIELPLDYVRSARVDESNIFDFPNKTLTIEFRRPMGVTSTLEGEREKIIAVGNHYSSPPCWSIEHRLGLEKSRERIYKAIGRSKKDSCFLFTGADMGNLSVQKAQFKEMTVYALVTAGVETNAVRMSVDEGLFYEPGTINVILMTNMKLSPKARARAVISATEGKTAAMQDLDIRSSVSPLKSQATGTGTDEVLVVEGEGKPIDNTGGHCKMGELIAKTVYDGVKEAVYRQNGILLQRSIFQKLRERHINPNGLLRECGCLGQGNDERANIARFEAILLQPRYAAFLESAFALSDAYERGLITDLGAFEAYCRTVSEEIAGHRTENWTDRITSEEIPIVLRMSLNALLNGMVLKNEQPQQ